MISARVATTEVTAAPPSPKLTHTDDWVLSVPLDDPWNASLRGVRFVERGAWRVFVAGFIYELDDLSKTLGGQIEHTAGDLVLAACERWGVTATIARLRGRFVVAIADRARGSVTVARDSAGLHPLYYAQAQGRLHFATHPRALFHSAGIARTLNRAALADHLCYRWPLQDETLFENVRRVRAGWQANITRESVRFERHWNPVPQGSDEWLTDAEVDRFDEVFDRAINRVLSIGRAGLFLSGGLDSISVGIVASDLTRRHSQPAPLALSLGFPDPVCDERAVQTSAAKGLGLPFHLIGFDDAVGPRGLFAEVVELNGRLASPALSPWSPAYMTLARAGRSKGIDVILTGGGGDEWLCVSPFFAADLTRRVDVAGLLGFMRMWRRSYKHSPLRVMHSVLWRFGMRPLASRALHRLAPGRWDRSRVKRRLDADPSFIAPDPDLREQQRRRAYIDLAVADPAGGFYDRELRYSLEHIMVSWEMEEQYELGRETETPRMPPYWDSDLVKMLYHTRPERLIRGGRSKGLVRDMVKQRLPGLGFERQRKSSASSFFEQTLRTEGPAVLRSIGHPDVLADLGVIDSDAARRESSKAFDRPLKQSFRLWHMLSLESWVRANVN